MSLENSVIGFVGGGNMAKAIAEGILKKGLVNSSQIIVSSPSESTLEKWKELKITAVHSNVEVMDKADIIFLSFKPYHLESATSDLNGQSFVNSNSKLVVSILAGITCQTVYNRLKMAVPFTVRIIRVMPNTPAVICEACSAIAAHVTATRTDIEMVEKIFSSIGKTVVVEESLLSAVTGLTGSGPAFVYTIIEALSDGAVKQGLTPNLATTFAAQTLLGAAKMVLEGKKNLRQLKEEVCTPGGTTIHGLHELEKGMIRATLMNAVEAAAKRAEEIGKLAEKKFKKI